MYKSGKMPRRRANSSMFSEQEFGTFVLMFIMFMIFVLVAKKSRKRTRSNSQESDEETGEQYEFVERGPVKPRKGPIKPRRILDPENDSVRKITLMLELEKLKAKGIKVVVEFGPKLQPKGKSGDQLLSLCGVIARDMVPITLDDWRYFPSDQRTLAWEHVKSYFDIPDSWFKPSMQRIGEAARNFRYDLHSTFIDGKPEEPSLFELPLAVSKYYTNIKAEVWRKFVEYKLSPKAKAARFWACFSLASRELL